MARLDKPIGIYLLLWPSLIGLLLSSIDNQLAFSNLLIVIIGAILVRSCGCVINDISDYKFDRLVDRTKDRPLANGELSLLEGWIFFIILGGLSLSLLLLTPVLTQIISLCFAILILVYPLSKRFFKLPQLILGITFGAGSLIAYSLQSSEVNISIFILYLGILFWIISFDTIYAMEDVSDDMIIGINSSPLAWGENSIYYSKLLQLLFYISILLVLIIEEFRLFIIIAQVIAFVIFEIKVNVLLKNKDYLKAFKLNHWLGFSIMISFIIQLTIN